VNLDPVNPLNPLNPLNLSLNPYGLTYTLGLQGAGTPRANPRARGVDGFIDIVRELGLRTIELDHRWLTPLDADGLARLRERLDGLQPICSFWLSQTPGEDLSEAVRCTSGVGANILRFHLTPVLEGARAKWGSRWHEMIAHAHETLRRETNRVRDAGLVLAIEDHQDVGSDELVELVEQLGPHTGICFDTGNPFSVGEDPVAFARRAAHRIRHVHLKDYVAQFTDEGYRLVRCAVGDGAVPFREIAAILAGEGTPLAASIEPGALESRHIRVFAPDWWDGYPPRDARELGTMLGRLRTRRLADDEDCRTPWEKADPGSAIVDYELAQVRRSVDNIRALGICAG
jgi:sugar phosphate isomerase/epimerase